MCNNIALNLAVTLQLDIGLGVWNTGDLIAAQIIQSPAYHAFVFAHSGVGNITIEVPSICPAQFDARVTNSGNTATILSILPILCQ